MKKKILSIALMISMVLITCAPIASAYETDVLFSWTKNLPVDDVKAYKLHKQDRNTDTYVPVVNHDAILDTNLNVTDTFVDENGISRETVKYSMSYETDGYPDSFILTAYNNITSSDYSDVAINDPLPPAADNVTVAKEFKHITVEFTYLNFNIDVVGFKLYADNAMVCESHQWEPVDGEMDTYTIICDYTFTGFPVTFELSAIDNAGGEVKSEPYVFRQDLIVIEKPKAFKLSFEGTLVIEPLPDPVDPVVPEEPVDPVRPPPPPPPPA